MAPRASLIAFALLSAASCKVEDVVLVPPLPPVLREIRVEPPSLRLVDDGTPPFEHAVFRAIGRWDDGERELTGVTWSLEDPRLGTIDGGAFTGAGIGGVTGVVASAQGASARAELTIALDVQMIAPGVDPAAFPTDTSSDALDAARLSIAYPAPETMFPQNARAIRHEWRAAPELDRFLLTFNGPELRMRVYTDQRRFVPDADAWRRLAATSAGGSVEMSVRALSTSAPGAIVASPRITLLYARGEIPGALYYWSTAVQGILRAKLDAPLATRAFPESGTRCAGCHTLSRDGKRIAFSTGERLQLANVRPGAPAPRGEAYGWGSFSPDGARLVYEKEGRLSVLDLATGEHTELAMSDRARATHPDWSPDGRFIAISYRVGEEDEGEDLDDQSVTGTSLARIPISAEGRFGAPVVLVRSAREEDTISFPAVSPDGALIAFSRTRGRSKDSAAAELFLVASDGSGGPISLLRANRRAGDRTLATGAGNTMPAWAPSTRPGVSWLVFSSVRPYALEPVDARRDQLWAAAIDPSRAHPGDDPSYSAFWLPFQTIGEGNHRAQWSADPADACTSTVDVCDNGEDDDCSGAADDRCCDAREEVCGNGTDDDCDGFIDEGCGCAAAEICGNGADDDCDGKTDGADLDCAR